jgi:O-antigen/teichoic acid export membrane protein
VSVSQVAQVFLNGTDVLIVGKMLGPAAVVPYACTAKLVVVLANHPQLLMQTAAPALSELRASGDRHRLGDVCAALTRAMLIVSGGVACLVLAINQLFVQWWVGPSQFAGWRLTAAVITMMLLRHLNTTNVYALFAFGQERAISLTALTDGAVTMVVSALLVHRYGIIGAPLGSLVGVTLVSLPINFWRLSHDLGVHWTYLIRQLRGWAIRFTVAAILCGLMGRLAPAQGFWALLVTASLAGVVYAGAMLPLALEPPLGKYVRAAWNPVAALLPVKRPIADGSRP